jgi:cell pole-organizing protein PopZ
MSKSSEQKDPSMDEILGSIRRIITEDNAQSGHPVEPSEKTSGAEEEDILELTDVLDTAVEPEPRREPILKPVETVAPIGDADAPEERREPVLGIHSPAPSTEQESATPILETPPLEPAVPAEAPDAAGTLPQEEEPAMATSDESGAPPVDQPASGGETVLSDTTSSATTAALDELNRAMDEKVGRLRLGEGDATVSDIVKELMRPMLREWIDENLPVIVERLVRREIQKLVDRAPDDD